MHDADPRAAFPAEDPPGSQDDRESQPAVPTAAEAAVPVRPGMGLLASLRSAPATVLFLGSCIALFAVAELHGSTTDTATLIRFGAVERGHVWTGQAWRLLTAGFLHIGYVHLLWNMFNMFSWCAPVERTIGSARFSVVYLGSILVASACSVLLHDVVSAGASGAGFGLVGATLAIGRRQLGSWRAFAAHPQVRRVAGTAVLWTVVLAWMNVDHAAHGGGFVAGAVLTWALTAPAAAPRGARRVTWAVAVLAVALPVALALVPQAARGAGRAAALDAELYEAMQRGDLDGAERVLARADQVGHRSPWLEYFRALVLEGRGDLAGAARILDELAGSTDATVQRNAASAGRALLAERLFRGDGMPADPARGRRLLEEACADGEKQVCAWLRENPTVGGDKAGADAPRGSAPPGDASGR